MGLLPGWGRPMSEADYYQTTEQAVMSSLPSVCVQGVGAGAAGCVTGGLEYPGLPTVTP